MTKAILHFRTETFGFFIDLANGGVIGVNRRSGEILLDEGDGEDCYHGAVIGAADFRRFSLDPNGEDHFALNLHFGENDVHFLGSVPDSAKAKIWTHEAEMVIRAQKRALDLMKSS